LHYNFGTVLSQYGGFNKTCHMCVKSLIKLNGVAFWKN